MTDAGFVSQNGIQHHRQLFAGRFGLDAQGGVVLGSSGWLGGATDYDLSLVGPDHVGSGAFIAAVTGTDGQIYLNQKPNIDAAWGGWFAIGSASDLRPVIQRRRYTNGYQILFVPRAQ